MEALIQRTREEYENGCDTMNWVTPDGAADAQAQRDSLIRDIFNTRNSGAGWRFSDTKLFTHGISPGCALCGEGDWSCLFVNNICNAGCFYCPSTQTDESVPGTGTVDFPDPDGYAEYVNTFKIRGVSFSGGEPLMTLDRVLTYLSVLRQNVSRPVHTWMYTNGILVTEDKLKALRDTGLNEIRFDISADHYRLDALKKAVGIIPVVTVEIPAIPEDLPQTRQVIRSLYDAGVDFLNLHQIRCTDHNLPRLSKRGYTFVQGPKTTVLETELTALELIRTALTENIRLPINYCSFTYRNQFQGAGTRQRNARMIKAFHENLTPTGHIRTLSVKGDPEVITRIQNDLIAHGADTSLWQTPKKGDRLFFNAELWPLIRFSDVRLCLKYSTAMLRPTVSFRNPFKEIRLGGTTKVVVERQLVHPEIEIEANLIPAFGNRFIRKNDPLTVSGLLSSGFQLSTPLLPDLPDQENTDLPDNLSGLISTYESFTPGLAPYY